MDEFIRVILSIFIDKNVFYNKNKMGNYKILFFTLFVLILFTLTYEILYKGNK